MKPKTYLKPFLKAPFYAVRVVPQTGGTMGGVKVNDKFLFRTARTTTASIPRVRVSASPTRRVASRAGTRPKKSKLRAFSSARRRLVTVRDGIRVTVGALEFEQKAASFPVGGRPFSSASVVGRDPRLNFAFNMNPAGFPRIHAGEECGDPRALEISSIKFHP